MSGSVEDLQREADAARQALAVDLDELKERVAPRRLANGALRAGADRARRAGREALRRARANPLPLTAGLVAGSAVVGAWLYARRRRSRSAES